MAFDLSKNDLSKLAEVGYEFELRFPGTNEPTGAFITVRGANSEKVKAFSRRRYNEMQTREAMLKKRSRDADTSYSIEELEDLSVDSAAVRVVNWRGLEEDGSEISCTESNVKRILKQHSWIREAVQAESDDLANFTKK